MSRLSLLSKRCAIRDLTTSDGAFIFNLLNQPSFIQNIGDRGVRTADEAADFIENRYRASCARHGFGMWAVELRATSNFAENTLADARVSVVPIGICGFVKRDYLAFPDIGFAFLPEFEGRGYAFEAAKACLEYGRDVLKFAKILAITTQTNVRSERLLLKLGFAFDQLITTPDSEMLKQFSIEL